jgi:uncharacterized small protein (DUF1192 family)
MTMNDREASAWTRGHAVGERELKAAEKRWQIERAELKAEVERLRAELARLTTLPSPPPLWNKGCRVCGIGSQPGVYGVVCARGDCPTRVTCTGAV